jgi:hypothetical protein
MHILVETTPLHGWVTLVEVSEALGIPYDTIRRVARKAYAQQQDWVKRAPYPMATSPLRWLVNTNHELYRSHAQCWLERVKPECAASEHASSRKRHDQKTVPVSHTTKEAHTPGTDVRETWPKLCQWLADWGLVVYVNTLMTEPDWRWLWDGASGSGYATAADAITAALQDRLLFREPFFDWLTSEEPSSEDVPIDDLTPDGERNEEVQAGQEAQV